jgi:flagellin
MIINNNLSALKASNDNKKAARGQDKASGKLQTGLRIRNAADDSAGLGISEKMRAQIRGLAQAARNIQDGISLVQTADGALGHVNEPTLQRMRELAVQAANDTLTADDRKKIQAEIEQLNQHLDDIFHNSEFNTQKIFVQRPPVTMEADIVPSPGVLVGDTILHNSGLTVITGENQTMTFKLDGVPYSISLTAGSYDPQQLLDEINQKLLAAGTDVTAAYSGDHIALNSPTKVIDSFGGDMMEINNPYTSILYDMAKHGNISGAAVLGYSSVPTSLTVVAGHNDTLTFAVDGAAKSITLSAGTYNQSGLLAEINNQLTAATINVTASYLSGNRLQLMHNISGAGHTLTSVGGNAYPDLFQQFTTLTESIYSGSYTTAGITGTKNLAAGITITSGSNDTLSFNVDGASHSITLTAGTGLVLSDVINDINTKFAASSLPLVASNSSGRLNISYNAPGAHTVDGFTGNACANLLYGTGSPLVQPGSYIYYEGDSTPQPNGYAYVRGVTDMTGGATIVAGVNDTFNFRLDGTNHSITLTAGSYSQGTLLTQINSKLTGLAVTAEYNGSYLTFRNTNEGGGISQFPYSLDNFSGNGYDAFMKTLIPVPAAGTDSKAYVYGQADLSSGLAVTAGGNDTLNFKVTASDGSISNINITLPTGNYTQTALISEINNQLTSTSARVVASYSGSHLLLTAQDSGSRISTFSGTAVDSLLRTKTYVGWASYYSPSATDAYVEGRVDLSTGVMIGENANDTLAFDLNGVKQSVTLAAGHYSASSLLDALNQKLAALHVTASYNAKQQLRLTYSPGVNGNYIIDSVGGNASYSLFYPGPQQIVTTEKESGPIKTTGTIKLQIGANAGMSINSGIPIFMDTRSLGVKAVNLKTQSGAETALTIIDKAISTVSTSRSNMEALQNALEATLNNVNQYNEHITAAEARLRDADMAQELMAMTKSSIMVQVTTAIEAKTNQNPQTILQLLQS